MTNKINDGNFNPIKSILSRYSICNINSNNYATIPIYTGNTTSTQQGVILHHTSWLINYIWMMILWLRLKDMKEEKIRKINI